jgi:hypothetical protein
MEAIFDWEALVRALALSLGIGILGNLITHCVFTLKRKKLPRSVMILAVISLVLTLTPFIVYLWPSLAVIPALDDLSQAQAEQSLIAAKLVPEARPQYADGVQTGLVVPKSQSLSPGLHVRPGTVVSFGVSVRESLMPTAVPSPDTLTVALFQPKAGESVRCIRSADGTYSVSVSGTSSGLLAGDLKLLLWTKPVNPPSDVPGWYLQRAPIHGISRVEPDGSWTGVARIGNAQWPPHEGDVVDLAVTIVDEQAANQLMAEGGVVVRDQLPGIKPTTVSQVTLTLK